jgi:amino acid transporter
MDRPGPSRMTDVTLAETSASPATAVASSSGVDVSGRSDVHLLRKQAIGLGGVLFISFASMSPLTGQLGNVPIAVGIGNGIGAPAGFEIGIVALTLFSVGYVRLMRRVPSSGGFYSFISHGLGRPLGMASGWAALLAYAVVTCSLLGAFGYFGNITISQFFHVSVPWPILGFGALILMGILGHFDIRFNAHVLGVALILEMVVLAVMDIGVFAHGGASGISAAPINPVNAFKGLAPGVGIFFAVWSWVGFETIPNYAEESRDPRRFGPWALYISVIGGGLFFAVCAWAAVEGWGVHSAVHVAATNGGNFYYGPTTRFVAKWVTDVMEWLIMTSSFACGLAFYNTTNRYLYVIGREKIFSHHLGRTHRRWESPHVANAVTLLVDASLTGIFFALYYGSPSFRSFAPFNLAPYYELFGFYAIIATFTVLVNQTICSLACITYFRKPENRDGWHLWTTGIIPALAIATQGAILWLLWANLGKISGTSILFVTLIPWICLVWLGIGILLALVLRARNPEKYETLGRMINTGSIQ